MMLNDLKVTIKSLGSQARVCRFEEIKLRAKARLLRVFSRNNAELGDTKGAELRSKRALDADVERAGIHHRRTHVVSRETRAALLAYGFIRGREYRVMENRTKNAPAWDRVCYYIRKYSSDDPRDRAQRFARWIDLSGLADELKPRPAHTVHL